jgi:uncharacterized membrane protein YfcA
VGAAAGFLSGLFGVGGGILIVPALVVALGLDQRRAHGTSLAAVLPIAAASLATYAVHDNIDWPVAVLLALGAVAGALLGTKLLSVLPHRVLAYGFAGLMVVSAVRLFLDTDAGGRSALGAAAAVALVLIGFAVGVLAGLLGVGGGVIMVPVMILVYSITPPVAKGTSLAVIIPTSIMGTWRNRRQRNADLHLAAVLGLSGIVSAALGGIVADVMSDALSNVLFALLLVALAARMLVDLRRDGRERGPGGGPDHR